MNNIKGYGFRPSDEELIGYLRDITSDRDSSVQFITQLEDICEFEPWELPGLSALQQGCRVWYFIYSLNYKYGNSKLIKRATKEGYWKPTGRRRKIMATDTNALIGSKRSLVFHKGHPKGKTRTKPDNNKNKTKHGSNRNKAVWVMHEYQLNAATPLNQETFFLGKLMKQSEEANIANNNRESSHHSPTNLRNQVAMNKITEDQSDSSKPLAEVEVSNDSGGVQNQSSTNDQDNDFQIDEIYPQERCNRLTFVDDDEVSNLISNLRNYAAVDAISRDMVDTSGWLITEQYTPNDGALVQNQFRTSEHGISSQNLIVADNNKTYPKTTSNQHYIAAENEGYNLPANLKNDEAQDFFPKDQFNYVVSKFDELLPMIQTPNNCNPLQNQSSTNEQDAETRNYLL
ncbi:hypothetical protein QUC31_017112 [Theobroma cacao]